MVTSNPLALVLTDDLMIASRIELGLRDVGYSVCLVHQSPLFLEALAEQDTAIALLELNSGIDLSELVSATSARGVPVLALGRHTDAALLRAAREAGCEAVVPRSEIADSLPALVERVRAGRGA